MNLIPILSSKLDEENGKMIREFILKRWKEILLGILFLIFILFKEYQLISGGILSIAFGIKYILPGIKEKKPFYFLIALSFWYLGLISIIAKFLLPLKIDLFIFIVIIIFVCLLLFYHLLIPVLNKKINFVALIISILLSAVFTISINSTLDFINSQGISNIYFYMSFILFIIFSLMIYFTFFRLLFGFFKETFKINHPLFNNYFYFSLSILFVTLFCGYHYLITFSKDRLKDFLIILSIAFITSFAGVSSIKSLEKK